MNEKLRVGFAGGNFGRRHINAFSTLDDVELTAIAEPNEDLRNGLADTFRFEQQFDSIEELLSAKLIDAIVIATPTNLHERHVCAAIDADLHVLCENPPATSDGEMSRISSTAGFSGKVFMWGSQQRFSPEIQAAHMMSEAGDLGKVYHATARWRWGFWPFGKDDWRGSIEQKGGALLDIGIHIIDSVWFAMGCPDPVEAFSSSHNHFLRDIVDDPSDASDDSSFGMVRFKNGSTITFESAYFSNVDGEPNEWNSPETLNLELWGTKASLDLVKARKEWIADQSPNSESYAESIDQAELFIVQAREFIDSIRETREPQNSRKQAQSLTKMLDALRQSAKDQKAVSIRTIRDLDDLFGGV